MLVQQFLTWLSSGQKPSDLLLFIYFKSASGAVSQIFLNFAPTTELLQFCIFCNADKFLDC